MAWVTAWLKARFASFVWRFTLLYTSLLIAFFATLFAVMYQLSVGELSRNQQAQLNVIARQQLALSQDMPHAAFISQLQAQAEYSGALLLSYQDSETAFGGLTSIPKHISGCPNSTTFLVNSMQDLRFYVGCTQKIGDGRLLIAFDDDNLYFLRNQFINAGIVALVMTLLMGLYTGRYVSTQLLQRIKRFNKVAQTVQAGDLAARVPIHARQDEFDLLASHINRMLDQVEASFDAISGVTDAIAHDLRTPLGRLRLTLETSLNEYDTEPVTKASLQAMLDELDHILATFRSMLELSRLEHKQSDVPFSTLDLNQIAEDVVDLLLPLAQEQQQSITLVKHAQGTLQGDRTLAFRAMLNAVENAIKYAGTGKQIELIVLHNGFQVRDNGVGIPSAYHDKVMQRLYRLESSRTSAGYGLGLPLIRAIAHFHGGELSLSDNHPGLILTVRLQPSF